MVKELRGSIAHILTATILTPIVVMLFINLTISVLHIYTRNNINQIVQESVNEITSIGTVTDDLNKNYHDQISKYKVILKNYEITYTFAQYDNTTGKFVNTATMIDHIDDSQINDLDLNIPTKITVSVIQLNTSTLQNIQNLLTGRDDISKMVITKSSMFKSSY